MLSFKMLSMPSPQLVSQLSHGLLLDSTARDLHFLLGDSRLSYHQSLVSQFSPFLRELLEEHLSLGLQEVAILLDPSLAKSSLTLLMTYLYTGQCVLASREQAAGVLELARLLQLEVSLQLNCKENKALSPRELQEAFLQRPLEDDKFTTKMPNQGSISSVIEDNNFRLQLRHQGSKFTTSEDPLVSLQLPTRPTTSQLAREVPEYDFKMEDKAITPFLTREDQNTSKQFDQHLSKLLEEPPVFLPALPQGLKLEPLEQEAPRQEALRQEAPPLRDLTNLREKQLEDRKGRGREDHKAAQKLQMKDKKYSHLSKKQQMLLQMSGDDDDDLLVKFPGMYRKTSLLRPRKCPDIFLQLPDKRIKLSDLASGSPSGTPAIRKKHSTDKKLLEEQAVTKELAKYVVEGSKESKYEIKKARDRLYKRLKRDGQPIDIKRPDIEAEMLNYYKATRGPLQQYQLPSPPHRTPLPGWHTVVVKTENQPALAVKKEFL